jgi:hypothetical protein
MGAHRREQGVPFSIFLDESGKLIRIFLQGTVRDADFIQLSKQVRSEPAFSAGWPVLYDASAATESLLTAELVRSLAFAARHDKNRTAFIAPTPAIFGLARMYQILSDGGSRIAVFTAAKPAAAWLRTASATTA